MQTRWQSFKESVSNTGLAFCISWASHIWVIMPLLDIYFPEDRASIAAGFFVTTYYTALSVIRNYTIRRWGNRKLYLPVRRASSSDGRVVMGRLFAPPPPPPTCLRQAGGENKRHWSL